MSLKPEFKGLIKEKRKYHNAFKGNVVEILYGAKDKDGNACMPVEGADDGHGRWYGYEVKGNYTMLSWQHSAEEGGQVEYGTEYGDHALDQMEADIAKRKDLCKEIEALKDSNSADADNKLAEIKTQWDAMKNWGTEVEKEYVSWFDKAVADTTSGLAAHADNLAKKNEVIAKLDEIKDLTNWKEVRQKISDIRSELDEIDSAGQEADEEINKKLRAFTSEKRKEEKEYYEHQGERRADAKQKKEDIIARTKDLTANVTNYKQVGEKLDALFNEWKAAGSAGKEDDETLWQQFSDLRKKFFDARHAFFEERNAEWKKSADAKRALIEEAKKITETNDLSRENTDRMKQLDKEWKAAGYSGKNDNDKLWDEFNTAKEAFWDAKKNQAVARFQTQLDEKKQQIDKARKEISDLQYRIEIESKPDMKDSFERRIEVLEGKVKFLQQEADDLQKKIDNN